MRIGLVCLAAVAGIVVGLWSWLGAGVPVAPAGPGADGKLYCVSYAPFRGSQTPLDPTTVVSAAQIEEDLVRIAKFTDCVRTYSTDAGIGQVAGIAQRHGLKVLQGLWLSSNRAKNQEQVESAIALAKQYPDTIRAIIVGNEVLLRGELSALDLAGYLRTVKAQVSVPVTYADVWEFWLRNRDLAAIADFVTIHILPYWEDEPIAAAQALPHIASIRQQVVAAFPGKEVIIGEVGWPSAGRMREGALPSLSNQARVIQDVVALARRENFRANIIEAFDAPWKRALEGTVGGHWGLFDDADRAAKFSLGEPVSDHPHWRLQAGGGVAMVALIFGIALRYRRDNGMRSWLAVSVIALGAGATFPWAVANVPLESLGLGGWLRSLALVATAFASSLLATAALMRGRPLPRLSQVIGPAAQRSADPLVLALGGVTMAALVLATLVALGLVFDPRYKDFPFAPLTSAILPLFVLAFTVPQPAGVRGVAEGVGAAVLTASVIYIVPNEMVSNWQSLWVCATLVALSLSLLRARGARD